MTSATHPYFVPNAAAGSRKETAILLVGTAKEFDIPQREIASTHTGFFISERLADLVFEDEDEGVQNADAEAEAEAEKKSKKSPKNASGNRAEKNNS